MPIPDLQTVFRAIAEDSQESARLENARPVIFVKKLSPEEKAEICGHCGHLKRYHVLSALPDGCYGLKCKYETCKTRCKGYKQKEI